MSYARQLRRFVRNHPQPSGAPRHSQPWVRLALASAAHYLASMPRPLSVEHPAEDESANDDWQYYIDAYVEHRDIYLRSMDRVAQEDALTALRTSEHARIEAMRAVRKCYGDYGIVSVVVNVFGPDWQDVPSVIVGEVS